MKKVLKNSLTMLMGVLGFTSVFAQSNITNAEYFFDNDPGFGNGAAISISSPAVNIASLSFNANVTSLSDGMHTLFLRSKNANGVWSITNKMYVAKVHSLASNLNTVSNITAAEYFYDIDPGYGNGAAISLTPASSISSLVFNANVTLLTNGMHTLYMRTKDAQNKWSETVQFYFVKFQPLVGNTNTVSNIVKAEYFFNTDPGFGNGTNIPVTAATDINGALVNINIASLPTGLHTLYIRTMDAQGKWSITRHAQFSKIQGLLPNPHPLSKINKAEYFYDVDPGFGNGTDIPLTPAYTITSLTFNADVSALPNGMHTMHVRTRDSLGQWGVTNKYYFAKVQSLSTNPHSISNIVKAEYFYDTDPGYGSGTDIPVAANTNISSFAFNADVTTISSGVHTLYLRTKDTQNKWSIVNKIVFAKVQPLAVNPHTISNITQLEYFLDTDPGFGNGTSVTITPATDINNISFNVDLTYVVSGAHTLYVRTRDAQGKWSITSIHPFNGGSIPTPIRLVSFEAVLQKNKSVLLEWITDMEANVKNYTIEKSTDATQWTWVGNKTPLSSNSNERRTYNLIDEHPGTGIIYYRLTETDLNGEKTIAPIRFVRIDETTPMLTTVYPNPNDGKSVTIQSDLFKNKTVEIAIIAADGKLYRKQAVNTNGQTLITIDDLNLPAGAYFINLTTRDAAQTAKLIVETAGL